MIMRLHAYNKREYIRVRAQNIPSRYFRRPLSLLRVQGPSYESKEKDTSIL